MATKVKDLTTLTAPVDADEIVIDDVSEPDATKTKKMPISTLRTALNLPDHVADPLVHIPLRRANDELRLTGTQTFTRPDPGTYKDPLDGLIKTAAIDTPRFERMADGGVGQLFEGASTNELFRSEEIDNVYWSKTGATITANAVAAPDGATTMDLITEDGSTGLHRFFRSGFTTDLTASTAYTYSFFLQDNGVRWIKVVLFEGTTGSTTFWGNFDVLNGVTGLTQAGTTSTITDLGGGIYRCTITATTTTAGVNPNVQIQADRVVGNTSATSVANYLGDSTSGFYAWGAQLEALPFASSYIKTTTLAVTRAVFDNTIPVAGNITSGAMTFIMDVDYQGLVGSIETLFQSTASVNNLLNINATGLQFKWAGVIANYTGGAIAINTVTRIVVVHNPGAASAIFLDGVKALSFTGGTTGFPTTGNLRIGRDSSGTVALFGHLRNWRVIDSALSDAEAKRA